ncbi:SDR family oxidoreductase [Bradyrhizobium sp. 14AA]
MDFGVRGKKAIVCGASKGLGKGCAAALAGEGAIVFIVARQLSQLESAAADIEKLTGNRPVTVIGDVTTAEGRAAVLAACPDPDILINNAGGPPPGDFRNWMRDDWIKALDANMLSPIELIKATVDKMIARKFGRIINITSHAVKQPVDMLGLSNGARTGLTGFVAGLSRATVRHNVTINNLLPGTFDTERLKSNLAALARRSGKSADETTDAVREANPARRCGTIAEFGAACAFLCSDKAGYITGQNILIDGGAYPGTF